MHHAFDQMARQSLACVTMGGPHTAGPPTDSINGPANPQCGPAMTSADYYADSAMISAGHMVGSATDLTSYRFDSAASSVGHQPGAASKPADHGAGSASASANHLIGSAMEPARHQPSAARLSVDCCASSASASASYLTSSASRPAGQRVGSASTQSGRRVGTLTDPAGQQSDAAIGPANHQYDPTDVLPHRYDTRYIYVITDMICSVVTVLLYILCCLTLCTMFLGKNRGRDKEVVKSYIQLVYCNICYVVTSPSCNISLMIVALWYSLFQLSSASVPDPHTCSSTLSWTSHQYRSTNVPVDHHASSATSRPSRQLNSSLMPANQRPSSANAQAYQHFCPTNEQPYHNSSVVSPSDGPRSSSATCWASDQPGSENSRPGRASPAEMGSTCTAAHLIGQIDEIDVPGRRSVRQVELLSVSNLGDRRREYSTTRADTGRGDRRTKVAGNDVPMRPDNEQTEWWMVARPTRETRGSQGEPPN